ncbi:MAG: hypothetical protein J1F63_08130 [Oscillospiraceae bacterium]|nr:hypothetical protein [Oscillospiraceae bacterium]
MGILSNLFKKKQSNMQPKSPEAAQKTAEAVQPERTFVCSCCKKTLDKKYLYKNGLCTKCFQEQSEAKPWAAAAEVKSITYGRIVIRTGYSPKYGCRYDIYIERIKNGWYINTGSVGIRDSFGFGRSFDDADLEAMDFKTFRTKASSIESFLSDDCREDGEGILREIWERIKP